MNFDERETTLNNPGDSPSDDDKSDVTSRPSQSYFCNHVTVEIRIVKKFVSSTIKMKE